jgi:RNA polymerase sigma-70 factor (ECF subfamily)
MGVPHADIGRLYEELGPILLAYARSIVQDPAEAEDALHHVFLKLMASGIAPPSDPRPYLFRAVRNTCLNRRRSEARAKAWRSEPPMFTAPAGSDGLATDLEAALRDLPEEQREVVVLRVWGEMTLDEAAQVLDVPLNTAASRYRYAVAKLRQRFGAHLRS